MMLDFDTTVTKVEQAAGGTLPLEYREWLQQYRRGTSDHRQTPFDLVQLFETQRIVQDVIPAGTLAIGDDGYGNLVLLRFADGSIEWWSHERQPDDLRTQTIRSSFKEFFELLAQGEV